MDDFADDAFESAAENPAIAAAAAALADDEAPPTLEDPLDGPVTLPGGFRRFKEADGQFAGFTDVTTAWVRELNGEDEERIARTKLKDDANAFLYSVLESGVERLGDRTPTRDDFESLLMGDRDFLLNEIARVTYGDEIEYEKVPCPHCGETVDVTLSISEDIPVKRLNSVDDATFDVPLRGDRVAKVNLPTLEAATELGKVQTAAEANTTLIAHFVEEIRGPKGTATIAGDREAAKKLGLKDRRTIVNEMSARMPGPQYNEVKFNHEPGCGEEIRLQVTLADLFLSL